MITKLQDTAQNFRQQIKNKQIDLYQQSAHALRLEMLQHDPNYPVYHFAPPEGWMNDPNGLIFYHNQYHLFYQYGPTLPDECVFHAANQTHPNRHGQMTWGHAVSEDLFHWRDLPIAMWPDQTFDCKGVYSGNMAVAPDGTPCALYTGNVRGHEETYGVLAIPQDELLNQWNKQVVMDAPPYEGTPTHWDAQIWKHGDLYYQLCGGCINGHGAANLYTSEDLLHWTFASTIYEHTHAAFWELPYLLELDGKHLLLVGAVGANCRNPYWIGHFDYSTLKFTPDHTEPLVSDTGTYYSYNPSMVDKTGRRIMFGWVTGPASSCTAVPYWQGLHSIPREIYLKKRHPVSAARPGNRGAETQ